MCADKSPDLRSVVEAPLIWLGGGHRRELDERHERATYAVAGLIVLVGGVVAGLVVTAGVADSTHFSLLVGGVLAAAVSRAIANAPTRGWRGAAGRTAVGVTVGLGLGELAALVIFAGSVDRQIDELAVRDAAAMPAMIRASADLQRAQQTRTALDDAVELARRHRDDALVVARCEYHPTPGCPQTQITGVPGSGPETRTANDLLADAQGELDQASTAREAQRAGLENTIAAAEQTLNQAPDAATAAADRGLGARWVALNAYSRSHAGAVLVRLVATVLFTLMILLPRIVKSWRGETTADRRAAARAEVDRAELQADTAIAVKRAEVRAATETLWADQQLATARLAVAAQTDIAAPVVVASHRAPEPCDNDRYLPIAAEAELAAQAATANSGPEHLPAVVDAPPGPVLPEDGEQRATSLIPTIPDITRTAARWIRPLVPPLVARAIDTSTQPIRAARQVFEEVEEITFTLKRTRKVNVHSVATSDQRPDPAPETEDRPAARIHEPPLPTSPGKTALPAPTEEPRPALTGLDRPAEVCDGDAPKALPPA